jgi:cytochrome c oxidase subunit 2
MGDNDLLSFLAVTIVLMTLSFVLEASPSRASSVHEVQVVAKRFAFEPAVIQVTAGEPVRLVIRSADQGHGFAIRDLNIDAQIPRSGNVIVEFTAPRAGRYEIACSEFCGSGHRQMKAVLASVPATPPAG